MYMEYRNNIAFPFDSPLVNCFGLFIQGYGHLFILHRFPAFNTPEHMSRDMARLGSNASSLQC